MVQCTRSWAWRLGLAGFLVIGGAMVFGNHCALAQITSDGTLGAESSQVTSPIPGGFLIEGGASRGTNLFHSFQEFSVPTNGIAYFNNALNIQNIMARVTGTSASTIDGLITANGTANLFLINPKGIMFGPNVWLDIGGSFFATTASSVVFGNGFKFSATNPEAPPLLAINVPIGLQYGSNAGSIQAQGAMLQVPNGKTLALVGGDVALDGSILSASNGRIELGSLASNNLVSLTPTNTGFALSYESVKNFQDIHLTQAIVDTSGNGGGSIQVQGRNVTLSDETFMLANTLGNQNGGGIFIQASRLTLEGGSLVNANVVGSGQGVNVTVSASDSVQVIGTSANGRISSSLSTQAQGIGQAGNLTITTGRLFVADGAQVGTGTFGKGAGGNLNVNASESVQVIGTSANGQVISGLFTRSQGTGDAGDLRINAGKLLIQDGAQVGADTFGRGAGGNLTVNTFDSVQVIGTSANGRITSRLSAQTQGTGNAGDLTITTGQLFVSNGAQVSASTFGKGNGGSLNVTTSESVQVIGRSADAQIGSGLFAQANVGSTGNAGNLTINTGHFLVSDGAQVSASALGSSGVGGNLNVNASESVQVIGTSANDRVSSRLSAQTQGAGKGGDLTINTSQLLLQNGAQISVSTLGGSGVGGNLNVNASESVQVTGTSTDGQIWSGLFARTQGSGDAGDLSITTGRLLVSAGAQVGAETFGKGNGGNLRINTSESVQVIGRSADNQTASRISAQTQGTGNAGDLLITTGQLLVSGGAQVGTGSFGEGVGGNLSVNASELVQLIGTSANGRVSSGLFAQTQGSGDAGDVTITTQQLLLTDGAQVSASTSGSGAGGGLSVNASELVQLNGTSANGQISSSLLTSSEGTGKAGDLLIATQRLLLADGAQVSASTSGSGAGGSLSVKASEAVQLSGTSIDGQIWSGLFARTQGSGDAGDLSITTQQLLVQNGAEVTVSSTRSGVAGNLDIKADSVRLDKGEITAQTTSGNGGNIALRVEDLLLLRHGSQISTTAGTAQAGGDGGNMNINAQFIVAVPKENSDITANAYEGRGGNINITTQGLFGIEYRPRLTPLSDITASSEFGVNGTVAINTPGVDPSRGLAQLPTNLVHAEELIDRHCTPNQSSDRRSSFTVTGRGGLPPSPNEPLRNEEVITNWITLPSEEENRDAATNNQPINSTNQPLVEAQGWAINEQGQVVLTAETTTVTPQNSWLPSPSCPASQTGTQ